MVFNIIIFFSKFKKARCENSGFTLVEVMVSTAIIIIIASVVVYNHQKFDNSLELNNVAYRIASSARQAQVYGISAKESVLATDPFKTAYGLHFLNSGSAASYIFFADRNGNGAYRVTGLPLSDYSLCAPDPSGNECVEQVTLGRGIQVTGSFVLYGSNWTSVNPSQLDIVFKRPNPDALVYLYTNYPSGTPDPSFCGGGACDGVAVCLASPGGLKKQVVILSTGQISVENVVTDGFACD